MFLHFLQRQYLLRQVSLDVVVVPAGGDPQGVLLTAMAGKTIASLCNACLSTEGRMKVLFAGKQLCEHPSIHPCTHPASKGGLIERDVM